MIHPYVRLAPVGEEVGLGLFATHSIPRGTLVWVLDPFDHVLDQEAMARLSDRWRPIVDRYAYVDANGDRILCWDEGRYMNHSCDANARGLGRLGQIAVRDIAQGEEITCDYAECNVTLAPCLCGSTRCRSRVTSEDLLRLAPQWDQEIRDAVAAGRSVPQPLLEFTRDPVTLASYFALDAHVPSIALLQRTAAEAPSPA